MVCVVGRAGCIQHVIAVVAERNIRPGAGEREVKAGSNSARIGIDDVEAVYALHVEGRRRKVEVRSGQGGMNALEQNTVRRTERDRRSRGRIGNGELAHAGEPAHAGHVELVNALREVGDRILTPAAFEDESILAAAAGEGVVARAAVQRVVGTVRSCGPPSAAITARVSELRKC